MELPGLIIYGALTTAGTFGLFCYNSCIITLYAEHFEIRWIAQFKAIRFEYKRVNFIEYRKGEIDILTERKRQNYLYLELDQDEDRIRHIIMHGHANDIRHATDLVMEKASKLQV